LGSVVADQLEFHVPGFIAAPGHYRKGQAAVSASGRDLSWQGRRVRSSFHCPPMVKGDPMSLQIAKIIWKLRVQGDPLLANFSQSGRVDAKLRP
jgi:hypothetical protein